jgi:energy-coupling factor transport system permease protein
VKDFPDYAAGDSALHSLNPLTKLILTFVLCVACFLTKDHIFMASVILCDVCLAAAAGMFRRSLRVLASLLALAFILFFVQVLSVRQGSVVLSLPAGFYLTDCGVSSSLTSALRMTAALTPLALMLSVTKMSGLPNVLVKLLRVPYRYAFVLTAAIRFMPIFFEETARIMEAQTARGVEHDTGSFLKKARLMLPVCAPAFASSVRRIKAGAVSARLRGAGLRTRECVYKNYPFGAPDAAAFFFCALVTAAAIIV